MPQTPDKPGTKSSVEGKHSPGPWRVESGDEGTFVTHGGPNGIVLCKLYGLRGNEDASLIAAAPELLELLERWHNHATHSSGTPTGLLLETAAMLRRIEGEG